MSPYGLKDKERMDIVSETIDRLNKRASRDEKAFGLGHTDGGIRLISHYFDDYVALFEMKLKVERDSKAFRGRKRELLEVDLEELTLAAMMGAVGAIGGMDLGQSPGLAFSNSLRYLATAIDDLCYSHALRLWNREQAEKWGALLKRAATLDHRRRLLRAQAREKGFSYEDWSDGERLNTAAWVVSILIEGPMFALDDEGLLTLTEEALANLDKIMTHLIFDGLFVRPQVEQPTPWVEPVTHIEGCRKSLVRTHQKAVRKFIERSFKAGCMGPTLEALNHAQSVRWRINEPILDLVKWSYEEDMGIPGIPRAKPLVVPKPENPLSLMIDEERTLFLRRRREIVVANKGFIGERIILQRDLATAEGLRGKPFWTHMNLDYRGRMYGMPHFNFQRSDPIRAMFMFDEGQALTREGLYWLKVHVANTGAFEKIDKAPFDDRVAWVDKHYMDLMDVARDPKSFRMWTEADSPFMFVAACMALRDGLTGKHVHIPVSFDGSCSGIQHLCAMMRSPEGHLVNLTPSEKPQDIYMVVADRVKERIELDTKDPEMSSRFLGFGIGRSLVKRNVMTYSYSSRKSGMTDQVMEDTMRPLRFSVLTGELPEHPFGEPHAHYKAARYLASHTFEAIEEVIHGPAMAMKFLQKVSRLYAHEGKPVVWHTPLGFPVMLRYPNLSTRKINLLLYDKGVKRRYTPNSLRETPGINKRKTANGIAPSFVHSMDACHLMMVLLECKKKGLDSVALVHDSFGCLPNDAPKFRDIIRNTFRQLYEQNDVLEQFRQEALEALDDPSKVPEVPPKGTLDLGLIEESYYCFA